MAWLAVDTKEKIFKRKPTRNFNGKWDSSWVIILPNGSIEKLIGRKMTKDEDPIELKRR